MRGIQRTTVVLTFRWKLDYDNIMAGTTRVSKSTSDHRAHIIACVRAWVLGVCACARVLFDQHDLEPFPRVLERDTRSHA